MTPSPKDSAGSFNLSESIDMPTSAITPKEGSSCSKKSMDTEMWVGKVKHSYWFIVLSAGVLLVTIGALKYMLDKHAAVLEEAKNLAIWSMEATDAAQVGVDFNGIVRVWSKGSEHMFGYTSEKMVGASVESLVPFEYRDMHEQAFFKGVKAHTFGPRIIKCDVRSSDGVLVPVTMTLRRSNTMFIATFYKDSEIKIIDLKAHK